MNMSAVIGQYRVYKARLLVGVLAAGRAREVRMQSKLVAVTQSEQQELFQRFRDRSAAHATLMP